MTTTPPKPAPTAEVTDPEASRFVEVFFDGRTYSADDLTMGDIEELEELIGEPIEAADFRLMKVVVALVYVLRRREEPNLTLEDLRGIKLRDLTTAAEGQVEGLPPSEPAEDAPATKAGNRGSQRSTASRRTTSTGSGRSS